MLVTVANLVEEAEEIKPKSARDLLEEYCESPIGHLIIAGEKLAEMIDAILRDLEGMKALNHKRAIQFNERLSRVEER